MSGRHRGRRSTPAPAALGVAVLALLSAFGAGAALLPASVTGPGSSAEQPEAVVEALEPGAGGGAPGSRASSAAAGPASSAAPAPSAAPSLPAAPPLPAVSPPMPPAESPAPPPPSPSVTPPPTRTVTATPKRSTTRPSPTRTAPTRPVTVPQAGSGQSSQETEVVRLTNAERAKAGCGAVELNTRLRTAMRLHVEELGTHGDLYISHVSDDGRSFADRARAQGYDAPGGENVARGQRDAADVMQGWMNSPGHRANIVNCGFKAIGVGMVRGVDGTLVWGQLFGRS